MLYGHLSQPSTNKKSIYVNEFFKHVTMNKYCVSQVILLLTNAFLKIKIYILSIKFLKI